MNQQPEDVHRIAEGDHYRNLYADATHRDLVVEGFVADFVRLRCTDVEHKARPGRIVRTERQMQPSRTGRSGLLYMGRWEPGAQLKPTPEGTRKNPMPAQPTPEPGQIWEDLNPAARLPLITVQKVVGGRVQYTRWTTLHKRTHQSWSSIEAFQPNTWGSRGYVYRAPDLGAYRGQDAIKRALDEIL